MAHNMTTLLGNPATDVVNLPDIYADLTLDLGTHSPTSDTGDADALVDTVDDTRVVTQQVSGSSPGSSDSSATPTVADAAATGVEPEHEPELKPKVEEKKRRKKKTSSVRGTMFEMKKLCGDVCNDLLKRFVQDVEEEGRDYIDECLNYVPPLKKPIDELEMALQQMVASGQKSEDEEEEEEDVVEDGSPKPKAKDKETKERLLTMDSLFFEEEECNLRNVDIYDGWSLSQINIAKALSRDFKNTTIREKLFVSDVEWVSRMNRSNGVWNCALATAHLAKLKETLHLRLEGAMKLAAQMANAGATGEQIFRVAPLTMSHTQPLIDNAREDIYNGLMATMIADQRQKWNIYKMESRNVLVRCGYEVGYLIDHLTEKAMAAKRRCELQRNAIRELRNKWEDVVVDMSLSKFQKRLRLERIKDQKRQAGRARHAFSEAKKDVDLATAKAKLKRMRQDYLPEEKSLGLKHLYRKWRKDYSLLHEKCSGKLEECRELFSQLYRFSLFYQILRQRNARIHHCAAFGLIEYLKDKFFGDCFKYLDDSDFEDGDTKKRRKRKQKQLAAKRKKAVSKAKRRLFGGRKGDVSAAVGDEEEDDDDSDYDASADMYYPNTLISHFAPPQFVYRKVAGFYGLDANSQRRLKLRMRRRKRRIERNKKQFDKFISEGSDRRKRGIGATVAGDSGGAAVDDRLLNAAEFGAGYGFGGVGAIANDNQQRILLSRYGYLRSVPEAESDENPENEEKEKEAATTRGGDSVPSYKRQKSASSAATTAAHLTFKSSVPDFARSTKMVDPSVREYRDVDEELYVVPKGGASDGSMRNGYRVYEDVRENLLIDEPLGDALPFVKEVFSELIERRKESLESRHRQFLRQIARNEESKGDTETVLRQQAKERSKKYAGLLDGIPEEEDSKMEALPSGVTPGGKGDAATAAASGIPDLLDSTSELPEFVDIYGHRVSLEGMADALREGSLPEETVGPPLDTYLIKYVDEAREALPESDIWKQREHLLLRMKMKPVSIVPRKKRVDKYKVPIRDPWMFPFNYDDDVWDFLRKQQWFDSTKSDGLKSADAMFHMDETDLAISFDNFSEARGQLKRHMRQEFFELKTRYKMLCAEIKNASQKYIQRVNKEFEALLFKPPLKKEAMDATEMKMIAEIGAIDADAAEEPGEYRTVDTVATVDTGMDSSYDSGSESDDEFEEEPTAVGPMYALKRIDTKAIIAMDRGAEHRRSVDLEDETPFFAESDEDDDDDSYQSFSSGESSFDTDSDFDSDEEDVVKRPPALPRFDADESRRSLRFEEPSGGRKKRRRSSKKSRRVVGFQLPSKDSKSGGLPQIKDEFELASIGDESTPDLEFELRRAAAAAKKLSHLPRQKTVDWRQIQGLDTFNLLGNLTDSDSSDFSTDYSDEYEEDEKAKQFSSDESDAVSLSSVRRKSRSASASATPQKVVLTLPKGLSGLRVDTDSDAMTDESVSDSSLSDDEFKYKQRRTLKRLESPRKTPLVPKFHRTGESMAQLPSMAKIQAANVLDIVDSAATGARQQFMAIGRTGRGRSPAPMLPMPTAAMASLSPAPPLLPGTGPTLRHTASAGSRQRSPGPPSLGTSLRPTRSMLSPQLSAKAHDRMKSAGRMAAAAPFKGPSPSPGPFVPFPAVGGGRMRSSTVPAREPMRVGRSPMHSPMPPPMGGRGLGSAMPMAAASRPRRSILVPGTSGMLASRSPNITPGMTPGTVPGLALERVDSIVQRRGSVLHRDSIVSHRQSIIRRGTAKGVGLLPAHELSTYGDDDEDSDYTSYSASTYDSTSDDNFDDDDDDRDL